MSIASLSNLSASSLASVAAAASAAPSASSSEQATANAATAQSAATAGATLTVSVPGSSFVEQERTTPDSLVVQPQMPPLLFDSWADAVMSSSAASTAAPAARTIASLNQLLSSLTNTSGTLLDVDA
jgi:hypothetical protein